MPRKKTRQRPQTTKKKKPTKPPATVRPSRVTYEQIKEEARSRRAAVSTSGRDIGPIPPIADLRRRQRCRDPRRFCETYNPEAFTLAWSRDHLDAIDRIREAAEMGALFAFAMDRGKGKTTLCRMMALWAISYRIVRYAFIIGATADKAERTLAAIKMFVRFLPAFAADFPEIAFAATALAGIANRASGQLCQGQPTLIEWAQDHIVLPTVPPPPNWPKSWPLRDDGMVPTSGSVIGASGLTGEGIRGSLVTLTTGEQLRPDLVLLDDPQTRESAHSPTQNNARLELVSGDLLGMAGPGKPLSAVMPCTVIAPGDFVDQILDRKKHPLWRGERRKMLNRMPSDMAAWDRYFEVYQECAQREPPSYDDANAYYIAHREELDAGAAPSWPERKLPWEISAVQSAMHLYFRSPRAFCAEYQNEPLPVDDVGDDLPTLTEELITQRLNRHKRGLVPTWATTLTASIDCHDRLLYWCVGAWGAGFDGAVAAYGPWPAQARLYYALRDANPTIAAATQIADSEGALYKALDSLAGELLGREWPQENGSPLRVQRCLIDSGWLDKVVFRFCRESPYAAILQPSKGYGITAGKAPMAEWAAKPGEKRGSDWLIRTQVNKGRLLLYDTNPWKNLVYERLLVPQGQRSALTLYGERPAEHRLLADHILAEKRHKTQGRGRTVIDFAQDPGRDNHLFDSLVGCAVAASMLGVSLTGEKVKVKSREQVVSFAEQQRRAWEADKRRRRAG